MVRSKKSRATHIRALVRRVLDAGEEVGDAAEARHEAEEGGEGMGEASGRVVDGRDARVVAVWADDGGRVSAEAGDRRALGPGPGRVRGRAVRIGRRLLVLLLLLLLLGRVFVACCHDGALLRSGAVCDVKVDWDRGLLWFCWEGRMIAGVVVEGDGLLVLRKRSSRRCS